MDLSVTKPEIRGGIRRYGLVRQFGPWKPTEDDIMELFAPAPEDPSDFQVLQVDAVGPTEDALIPYELGGGFSLVNGSVVDPPTYDPRWAVPGRKMIDARPMEEAGSVVALTGQYEGGYKLDVNAATPYDMPNPNMTVTLTETDLKNIADIQARILATQQTGIGPFYDPTKMINIYKKMTATEQQKAKDALLIWAKMTTAQRAQEFLNPNSIMRRIYTLYKAEMPAKYLALLVDQTADMAMFAMFF
jgi:hypothetical protein